MPIIVEGGGTTPVVGAVTVQQLADYCGAAVNSDVERALAVAIELVDDALEGAYKTVPDSVMAQLLLEVGYAVRKRSTSPSGGGDGVGYGTGQPVQGPKDPLATVWHIIRRYRFVF
jgi:hypothetical protein